MTISNLVVKESLIHSPRETQDDSNANIKTYAEICDYYNVNDCWGLQASVDAKNCDPALIRSADAIKEYVLQLCDLIKMKRFQETVVVNFGEDERVAGYSMVQLIETSLISGHFANLTNAIYIDIFSCKIYNPYEAAEFTREYFKSSDAAVHLTFRK
jgi:S-adenosylmethionine/arginine decarboxylase-like enzyme